MTRRIQISIALAAGLLSTAVAWGADPAGDAARRCALILGERERLACFDRAFPAGPETAALAESRAAVAAPPVVAPAPVAVAPVAPVAPAPVAPVAPARAAAPAPPPPASTPAAPAATAAVATAAVAAAPSLGDEQVRKSDKATREAKAATAPQNLTARVTALKQMRQDVWRMSLDNGQTWQQMDMSTAFHPTVGDTVQIQRKKMGGYTLALAGDKKSTWVRVSRVE